MKTETYPEEANLTAGQILRQAREKLELSQQTVADRLCLKVSTVRDIEEDNAPDNIVPTFFRGYIRAYAKLVQVPEAEILAKLDAQMPHKALKTSQMQSFSAQKIRKKRDGWLMKFTWLVIIVLLGMTGVWWWQNYQVSQKDLVSMTEQSDAQVQKSANEQSDTNSVAISPSLNAKEQSGTAKTEKNALLPLNSATTDSQAQLPSGTPAPSQTQTNSVSVSASQSPAASGNTTSTGITSVNQGTENPAAPATNTAPADSVSPTNPLSTSANQASAVNSNELVFNFKGRCWLEVRDSKGKVLFSGTKYKGNSLKVSGSLPYSLNVGVPSQVEIEFQGKRVNMDAFIKKGTNAKLTLP
ncbi:cytoskeleton protein RodZ [Xenorhabdus innexi]|uniref:Cytoskeletal protein RodZ n=1 Tax=Xenorhabdus innexi TaxID=290109 RepID=A0A1N6MVH7_9GAMM|nr:cytoskeleton protein RodZ [Xenorhabdus innexi]PHM38289.1 cytoskeletal protein RodZ [Xenorhabdus innexi]SIP72830.1 Cytoskeleton protein rodZ [Xenorhabdus innexi]